MTQTSWLLSQRTWPGHGDLDDCWVASSLQCVHAVAPWFALPGTVAFRKAAGDPDDGHRDGGSITEIVKGVTELWPIFDGRLNALRDVTWERFKEVVKNERPVSVALMTGKLPTRLRYGAGNVAHQTTVVMKPSGRLLFANPLAPMGSKWDDVDWNDIRPAILDYGKGNVFGVAFPKDQDMVATAPGFSEALKKAVDARPQPDCKAKEAAAFADAKAKALAAVGGITR